MTIARVVVQKGQRAVPAGVMDADAGTRFGFVMLVVPWRPAVAAGEAAGDQAAGSQNARPEECAAAMPVVAVSSVGFAPEDRD